MSASERGRRAAAVIALLGAPLLLAAAPEAWHQALRRGDVAAIRAALDAEPRLVAARDADGHGPLHRAAIQGHRDAVALLLERGADPNAEGKPSVLAVAIFFDVYEEWGELIELLIEHGARLEPGDHAPALHFAALSDRVEHARRLLEAGADVNAVWTEERRRSTALDLARSEPMRVLLRDAGGTDAAAIPEVVETPTRSPARAPAPHPRSAWDSVLTYGGAALAFAFALFWFSPALVRRQRDRESLDPERDAFKGSATKQLGLVLMFGGAAVALLAWTGAFGTGPGAVALGWAGFAAPVLGFRLARRGAALRSTSATEAIEKAEKTEKPPILFLRAFDLDEESPEVEQSLVLPLRQAGPLVAIGRPGESTAMMGAHRDYVADDVWQEKVFELVEACQFTLWVYGSTEGLRWEIRKLVEHVPPEKIVVVLPWWNVRAKHRVERWREARATLGEVLPCPLPEELGSALFLRFASDWTPKLIAPPERPLWLRILTFDIHSDLGEGALSLLEDFGHPVSRSFYTALRVILPILGWALLGLFGGMFYGLYIAFFD